MLGKTLNANIQQIKNNIIKATNLSYSPKPVTLVCVSKSVDLETTQQVVDTGITHLAENRVEKLLFKKANLTSDEAIKWHFIGNLQRRKVKEIVNEIDYFHALDNVKLAAEIQKRAEKALDCFIPVNVSGEASKQGFSPNEVEEFVASLENFDKIRVVGLMTMAPFDSNEAELRSIFSQLNQLGLTIANKELAYAPCTELSMGMSQDYQIAIEEGATFVRVGSKFFDDEEKEVEER